MGNAVRYVRGESQKNIVRLIQSISGRYSTWQIWQDFIVMSAVSIANSVGGPYAEERERMYLERANKYSKDELNVISQMFAEVIAAMERNPAQDFLGDMFMALGLGNECAGQFFTPYHICECMSAITCIEDFEKHIDDRGWASVNDPACGAGALLVAFANECQKRHINYQTSVLFVAQDIDFLAGCMCYIQLSLLGCPGYVVIANTLTNPSVCFDDCGLLPVESSNVWFTPMYYRDIWSYRRMFTQIDLVIKKGAAEKEQAQEMPIVEEELPTTETGQFTLFGDM